MQIKVYICPTEGCGNFFASSSARPLEDVITGDRGQNFEIRPESEWHTRAQCPDCRANGKKVERIPVTMEVKLPVAAPVAA